MSTVKKRYCCVVCGKKTIIDKLVLLSDKYYHLECAKTLTKSSSSNKSVYRSDTFKSLTDQLLFFKFNDEFWLYIRYRCPQAFLLYFTKKYPNYKIDKQQVISIVQE